MPVIDDDSIEQLVSSNLRQLHLITSEQIEKITPKLSRHYYFLKGKDLSEEIQQTYFNYVERVERMKNYDQTPDTERLSKNERILERYSLPYRMLYAYKQKKLTINKQMGEDSYLFLKAISKEPAILTTDPDTIGRNFAGFAAYLHALRHTGWTFFRELFLENPKLFLQDYQISIGNIETVHKHFESKDEVKAEEANKWLDEPAWRKFEPYVRDDFFRKIALFKYPVIIQQDPCITINNIEEVSRKFSHVGLTDFAYLQAIKRVPELILQSPEVTINHVNTMVRNLVHPNYNVEKHRTLKGQFVKLAVHHPELFMPGADLNNRFALIYKSYERGDFKAATRTDEESFEPVVRMLLRSNKYWKTSDELIFKQILATTGVAAEEINTKKTFLDASPKRLKNKCFEILGHPNKEEPVPKLHTLKPTIEDLHENYPIVDIPSNRLLPPAKEEEQGKTKQPTEQEQADNLLLRTLIHAGVLEGKLSER